MYYSQNRNVYFTEDVELIGIYVKKHKCLKDKCISLNPKYDLLYQNETLVVNTKKDFVDIFPGKKLNIKVLCGRNGVGKTTVLNLIEHWGYYSQTKTGNYIILFRDSNNNFFTNKPNLCIENDGQTYFLEHTVGSQVIETFNYMTKVKFDENSLIHYYMRNKNLYNNLLADLTDNGKEDLFTKIRFKLRIEEADIEYLGQLFQKKDFLYGGTLDSYFNNHPLMFLLLDIMQHMEFFDPGKYEFVGSQFITSLSDLLTSTYHISKEWLSDNDKRLKQFIGRSYRISNYEKQMHKLRGLMEEISSNLDEQVKRATGFSSGFHKRMLDRIVAIPYTSNGYTYDSFSDGEKMRINEANRLLTHLNNDAFVVLRDEPMNAFHPEWARRFIYDYVYMLDVVKAELNYKKHINVVITTHSPFVLSDLTADYIEYMDSDSRNAIPDSFAGNIGMMFNKNFFMNNGTIGEYAKDVLKKVIDHTWDGDAEKIINKVADPLLKKLLLERQSYEGKIGEKD